MLSSLFGTKKGLHHADRSPFSSPFTQRTSPIAARRGNAQERRHVAADYESVRDGEEPEDDGDDAEEAEDDEDEDGDDDGHQNTPLLPIFEASHLGSGIYSLNADFHVLISCRRVTGV